MDLESALKKAEHKVWRELEPVNPKLGKIYTVREEGLTSMALKELATSNCTQIHGIEMIPSSKEKVRGYDFEICIGSKKKGEFVRFFIQAKKIKRTSISGWYDFDDAQCHTLEVFSKKYRSIPLYALYNHLTNNDRDILPYYNSNSDYKREYMGITMVPTVKMKIKGKRSFKDLHSTNIPAYYRLPFFRYHPSDIDFYEDAMQAAVPMHELAYFTIERAKQFNKRFKKLKSKNKLNFFFFFFENEFLDDGEELIPIIKASPKELVQDFYERAENIQVQKEYSYKSEAILIFNQD